MTYLYLAMRLQPVRVPRPSRLAPEPDSMFPRAMLGSAGYFAAFKTAAAAARFAGDDGLVERVRMLDEGPSTGSGVREPRRPNNPLRELKAVAS